MQFATLLYVRNQTAAAEELCLKSLALARAHFKDAHEQVGLEWRYSWVPYHSSLAQAHRGSPRKQEYGRLRIHTTQVVLRQHRLGAIAAYSGDLEGAATALVASKAAFTRLLGSENPLAGEAIATLALVQLRQVTDLINDVDLDRM